MPIQVTCPSCLKRFQVSDKFAGKTGACPNCKGSIKVPDKSDEVKIHAPDDGAPKDRTGKSVLKPLVRTETDVTKTGMIMVGAAVLTAVGLSLGLRLGFTDGAPLWGLALGAIMIAPPLVWAGYTFVQDAELAPFSGSELRNRVLVCSLCFAALWLLYALIPSYLFDLDSPAEMEWIVFGVIFSVMLAAGAFISVLTFELEFFGGLVHAGLYLIATFLLALLAGVTFAGVVPEGVLPA